MKIYDCFSYFNEDLILELRLETLWDSVDYFIISEATYSHSGEPRNAEFNIKKFSKYASKIRYLCLSEKPPGKNNFWKNENFVRNNIIHGLYDADSQDLVLISDLDEIPNPVKIKEYDENFLRGDFEQTYYSYFLNNRWIGDIGEETKKNRNAWYGSKITTYSHFMDFFKGNATSVRSYKSSGILRSIKRAWFRRFNVQIIKNGGWHFTWILTINNIIKKIQSSAHQEYNLAEYKTVSFIENQIKSGRDVLKPNSRYQAQPINQEFPQYLVENQDKFKEFLLKP